MAIALCMGRITCIGRVWADGQEIDPSLLNMRVYEGTEQQSPDPKMEAVEGAGMVPGYRGMAYVVFEDLDLARFGNRVPQFSFEVFRPAERTAPEDAEDAASLFASIGAGRAIPVKLDCARRMGALLGVGETGLAFSQLSSTPFIGGGLAGPR